MADEGMQEDTEPFDVRKADDVEAACLTVQLQGSGQVLLRQNRGKVLAIDQRELQEGVVVAPLRPDDEISVWMKLLPQPLQRPDQTPGGLPGGCAFDEPQVCRQVPQCFNREADLVGEVVG